MPLAKKRATKKDAALWLRLLITFWLHMTISGIDEHCRHSCAPDVCTFTSKTSSCETAARQLFNLDVKQELPHFSPCPSSSIRAVLLGRIVEPKQYLPFVMLNVSTLVDMQGPTAVLFTFKCITSYGRSNKFCDQPRRPCRMVKWNAKLESLFSNVECFHMPPMSLIEVNVTVNSMNCTLRYYVQSPEMTRLQGPTNAADWLPFVVVDPNADDCVIVNVSRPPSSIWLQGVLVEVLSHQGDLLKLHYSEKIPFPDDSVRISNLAAGDYVLHVQVLHPRCPQGRCLYQSLSMQLDRPYPALASSSLNEHALVATLTALGLLLALLLIILFLMMRQRKKSWAQATVLQVNPRKLVKVFLLYSHDSEVYCNVAVALANLLKDDFGCEVMLDEWALRDSLRSPADWVLECMDKANFYLLLFSEGVNLFCNGSTTEDGVLRPWTNAWQAVVKSLCQQAITAKSTDDRTPYICATLSPTPLSVLPAWLTLPCWFKCRLPEELSTLACHLHGLPEGLVDHSCSEAFQRFQQAITAYEQCQLTTISNSDTKERPPECADMWKQTGQTLNTLQEEVSDAEVNDNDDDPQKAFDRYASACRVYQLIPPDETSQAQKPQKYGLLPPDDSDDDVGTFVFLPSSADSELTKCL
uniref:SEFIR domain-containing protein n=1 Tax=Trichuris muris TaxID=70415 RepID=A0A5S6R1G9_TRIMR